MAKWAVVRKADGVQARYSCREFKRGKKRYDLLAPSTTTVAMRTVDIVAAKRRLKTLTGDISNSVFHAPEDAEVFNQPPEEWYEAHPEHIGKM